EEHEHEHGKAESLEAHSLRGDLESEEPGQEEHYGDQVEDRLPSCGEPVDSKQHTTLPCHDRATPCGGATGVAAENGGGPNTHQTPPFPPGHLRGPRIANP